MKKSEWLLKNTVIFAVGNILVKLVQFFLLPLYTAVLTKSEYAVSDLFNNTVEIMLPLLTLSITDAVFRFSMDRDAKKEELLCNGILVMTIGTIICALLCIPFDYFMGDKYPIWLFLPLFFSAAFRQLISHYVRAIERVKDYAISSVINALAVVLFAVVFLTELKMGVSGYIFSIICANFISIIYLLLVLVTRIEIAKMHVCIKDLRVMICYSAPLIANTISWWLTNTSSRYIVIVLCGAELGGLFAAASKIPALMNVCINTFQQAWVMSAIKEYDGDKNTDFQSEVFRVYSGLIYLLSAVVIIIVPFLGKFLLQGEFYAAWRYVPMLVVSATIGGLASFFGAFYSAVKKNMMSMISTLTGGGVNVVLCVVLTYKIGIFGALIASVVAYTVISAIRIITTYKYAPIKASWGKQVTVVIALVVEAVFMSISDKVYSIPAVMAAIVVAVMNRDVVINGYSYLMRFFKKSKC